MRDAREPRCKTAARLHLRHQTCNCGDKGSDSSLMNYTCCAFMARTSVCALCCCCDWRLRLSFLRMFNVQSLLNRRNCGHRQEKKVNGRSDKRACHLLACVSPRRHPMLIPTIQCVAKHTHNRRWQIWDSFKETSDSVKLRSFGSLFLWINTPADVHQRQQQETF